MTRYYDIDAANAAVPELDGIVGVLAEQRAELVRLRDEVLAAGSGAGDGATTAVAERAVRPAAESSSVSPGMNRRTARRMNRRRGRRSLSHRLRAAHRKTRRIETSLAMAPTGLFG